MKKALLTVFFAVISLGAFAQFSTRTILHDGISRSYRQYIPSGLNPQNESVPLVIALHGMGDDISNFSNVGFSWFADTARFICVFPQGETNFLGSSAWNNGTLLSTTTNDVSFISMLMDSFIVNYNVNPAKIYVCGFSMGAIMSNRLMCELPNRVAAIAPVSGAMSTDDLASCNPGRAVPVMMLNGTADGVVPYNSTPLPSLSLVTETRDFWRTNNSATDSVVTALPDVANDTITVDHIIYTGGGAPVELWRENGADHQWLYTPVNDIDATTEIWLFFSDKVHPSPSLVGLTEQNTPKLDIYYNGTELVLHTDKAIQQVELFDIQGKCLFKSGSISAGTYKAAVSNQSTQMVVVKAMVNNMPLVKKVVLN